MPFCCNFVFTRLFFQGTWFIFCEGRSRIGVGPVGLSCGQVLEDSYSIGFGTIFHNFMSNLDIQQLFSIFSVLKSILRKYATGPVGSGRIRFESSCKQ